MKDCNKREVNPVESKTVWLCPGCVNFPYDFSLSFSALCVALFILRTETWNQATVDLGPVRRVSASYTKATYGHTLQTIGIW